MSGDINNECGGGDDFGHYEEKHNPHADEHILVFFVRLFCDFPENFKYPVKKQSNKSHFCSN